MKNNILRDIIFIAFGFLLSLIAIYFITENNIENKDDILDNVSNVAHDVKKGDVIIDISDAKNYIDQNIPENFPEVRNMYYTAMDIVKWEMYMYPDLDGVNQEAEQIMISTFCLANTIQQKDMTHINKMLNLLVEWDYKYKTMYLEINAYLNTHAKIKAPDLQKVPDLCEVFNKYPAQGFENFLISEK